jgi:HAE1 family hydrophobic/amphiphilic exporter-1
VLGAILLKDSHRQKWWWLQKFDDGVVAVTRGYRRLLHFVLGYKLAMAVVFFAGLGLTYFVFTRVPTGFVPDEDQGYFIIVIQAPSGASLEYTKAIGKQVSDMLADVPEAEGTFSVAGFSFSGAAANQGIIFVPLKPYSQRKGDAHTASAISAACVRECLGFRERSCSPRCLRRFKGWDSSADFSSWCRIRLHTSSKNWRAQPKG